MSRAKHLITKLPPKDTPSGWLPVNGLQNIGRLPSADWVKWFDWTVIGGGFTGLAA